MMLNTNYVCAELVTIQLQDINRFDECLLHCDMKDNPMRGYNITECMGISFEDTKGKLWLFKVLLNSIHAIGSKLIQGGF